MVPNFVVLQHYLCGCGVALCLMQQFLLSLLMYLSKSPVKKNGLFQMPCLVGKIIRNLSC